VFSKGSRTANLPDNSAVLCSHLLGINFENPGSQGEQGDDGGGERAGGGGGARTHLPRPVDTGPAVGSIFF
jgi:hypothetical protein